MKRLLSIVWLLFAFRLLAQNVTLMVATNGTLAAPTNFFRANTNRISAALNGVNLTNVGINGGKIWGTFTNSAGDTTIDGAPGGGGGVWTKNFTLQNFDNLGNNQVNHINWYGRYDGTLSGGNLYLTAYTNLYFNTPEIASFSLSTNAVPVLVDPVLGQVKFVPLESLQLGSTITAGKIIGKHTSSKQMVSGTVDVTDVASAATLTAVSATASGAAQKSANLSDLASASSARSNLGLVAVAASGSASDLTSGILPADRLTALTGDVTSPGGSATTTLTLSGVAAGSYGSATTAPVITFDTKGRATTASAVTITPAFSSLTAVPSATTVQQGIVQLIDSTTSTSLTRAPTANAVSTNTAAIVVNTAQIAVNTTNIATNTAAIAVNTANITTISNTAAYALPKTNGVAVSATATADPTTALGLATKQYVDTRTRFVTNVAAMQSLTGLANNDVIITAGRTTAGDVKMPMFVYKSASALTTNLGTVFTATGMGSGQLVAQYNGPAFVEWYGAVGDSVTDNATALTNAFTYHGSHIAGITPLLNAGPGVFLTSVSLTNHNGLIFTGAGGKYSDANSTRIHQTTVNVPGMVFAADCIKSKIQDIYLTCTAATTTAHLNNIGIYWEAGSYDNEVNGVGMNAYNYSFYMNGTWQNTLNNPFVNTALRAWLVVTNGGTTIQVNHPYFQGGYVTTNSAAITNITKAAGTNLTIYLSSTPPAIWNTNFLITLTGLQANLNSRYFIQTISGNQIGVSANADPGTLTGVIGTAAFYDGTMLESPIQLSTSVIASFIGADFEHAVIPAGPLVSSSASLVSFDNLHLESISSQGSYQLFKQDASGLIDVGPVQFITSTVVPGATMTAINPNNAAASINIHGGIKLTDIGKTGGTMNLALISAGKTPVVAAVIPGATSRANASQSFDSTANAVILADGIFPSNVTVGGTLGVTGASTLASASITGSATVGTTLGVTGATTLTGNLIANGATDTLAGNVTLGQSANIASASHNIFGQLYGYAQGQNPQWTMNNYGSTLPILALGHALGTYASPTGVTSSSLGRIQFNGYNGASFTRGSQIVSDATETWGNGASNGATMYFAINPNASTTVGNTLYFNSYYTVPQAEFYGDISAETIGKTLKIKSGSNALSGTVTLVAGVGTITSSAITTSTVIDLSLQSASGARTGALDVIVSAGSATVTTVATDAGTYVWTAIKKN